MSFELDSIVCGDCLDLLPTIPSGSVDAVISDPPYPYIKRDYGYWTTAEWWSLMVDGVIPQVRRVLKPTGSAVFILQPNSEKVGKMRGWLWEFMAWVCREWNMVQDVWWWNITAIPEAHAIQARMMRPSIKACVWAGSNDCYRNQNDVLWTESQENARQRSFYRIGREIQPSGHGTDRTRAHNAALKRGGVTPFNLLPFGVSGQSKDGGSYGHGAGTPLALADWWLRYIVPPGGLVVDPFMGSGTTALAALKQRKHWWGCDKEQRYVDIANRRVNEARPEGIQAE